MKHINLSSISAAIAATSLFVALGGAAEAASLITGKSVKNGSLTGADVRSSSLTGSDVKNNGLTGVDIKSIRSGDITDGSLTKADFAAGQLTAGTKGDKGDKGEAGPEGPSRWVTVDRAGNIESQSGGFRIANAYPAGSPGEANVYIDSGDANLANNGLVATIGAENQYSLKGATPPAGSVNSGRNAGADANPEFSGEVTATRCAIGTGPNAVPGVVGVVACAPLDTAAGGSGTSTNTNRYFVVSPRNSDGSFTVNDTVAGAGDNTHKRFTVVLSGTKD